MTARRTLPVAVATLALAGGCGGNGGASPAADGGDAAADVSGGDAPADVSDVSGPVDELQSCATLNAALAIKLHELPAAQCTVVVRLDFQTLAVLGYQVICGPAATPSEAAARATADADTGFGATADRAPALSPAGAADEFVFYQTPSDLGGVAAVSARNGLTVFGGGVVFAGRGDITYPKTWRPAAELGGDCVRAEGIPSWRGYGVGAAGVDAASIAAAVDAVAGTAVPAAMWRSGRVIDAVALGYARAVGQSTASGDTTSGAEWIVLVNGE